MNSMMKKERRSINGRLSFYYFKPELLNQLEPHLRV